MSGVGVPFPPPLWGTGRVLWEGVAKKFPPPVGHRSEDCGRGKGMARRNQSQFLQRLRGVGVAAHVLGVESVRCFATVNLGTPRVFTPQFCTHWR